MKIAVPTPERIKDNLRWCVTLLTKPELSEAEAEGRDNIAPRFARAWADPTVLPLVLASFRFYNHFKPLPIPDVWVEGTNIKLRDRRGHTWTLLNSFDEDGNFADMDIEIDLAEPLTTRLIGEEELAIVDELDAVAALQFPDGLCEVDKAGTMATSLRLLPGNHVRVVEEEGRPIAMGAKASFPVLVDGKSHVLSYMSHFRTLKAARGLGLSHVIGVLLNNGTRNTLGGALSVAHGDNMKAMGLRQSPWEASAVRAVFRCSELAATAAEIETADPTNGVALCNMINKTHGSQELFVPYTPRSFEERLGRAPEAYGWAQVRHTTKAVLGTWMAGETRRFEKNGACWTEVRGLVLDYGFEEDGLDAFEILLRHTAQEALGAGMSHLALFTSSKAPVWPLVDRLAERVEPYYISCSVKEPATAATRGIYIDPVLA